MAGAKPGHPRRPPLKSDLNPANLIGPSDTILQKTRIDLDEILLMRLHLSYKLRDKQHRVCGCV